MAKKSTNKKTANVASGIFFAYQSAEKSGNGDNVDAIKEAVSKLGNTAKTWESMRINGKLINKQILSLIDMSAIFACDMTYLNTNVFFELGYAIGKKKTLLILLNPNVVNAVSNYAKIDILKNVGYTKFSNANQIIEGYKNQTDHKQVLVEQISSLSQDKIDSLDLFYIQSTGNSQAELDVLDYIKKSDYTSICDDTLETSYQPLEWYIQSLMKCRNIIVHLTGNTMVNADLVNAKNSLFAGLGYAFGKNVVLVAPKPYYAPIDYSDILLEYSSSAECIRRVSDWLQRLKKVVLAVVDDDKELNLLKLGIGCSIAEDEKDDLAEYFIETQSYKEALKNRNTIFYGRKGTGKTALYIKIIKDNDYDNIYVIGLKPESTELLDQIKSYDLISDIATKKSVFSIAWKRVLLSQLLTYIYLKIIDSKKYEYTPEESELVKYYEKEKGNLSKSFFATLLEILTSNKSSINVVEDFSETFLNPLERIMKKYLLKTRYIKVIILADNLDKAWDPNSNLDMQAEMILSLMEASDKFQTNLIDKKQNEIVTNAIIFLRKDIYTFVLRKSREPDKITIFSHEIEWGSFPELLRTLIVKRMMYVLEMKDMLMVNKIWIEYFEFGSGDPFNKVAEVCYPRPRDIIYFFAKMFESACNNSRSSVTEQDFEYAKSNYIVFLHENLIAEMQSKYPYIKDAIDCFGTNERIELSQYRKHLNTITKDRGVTEQLINDLCNIDYLVLVNQKIDANSFSYNEVRQSEKLSSNKIMRFIHRDHYYVMPHHRYSKR